MKPLHALFVLALGLSLSVPARAAEAATDSTPARGGKSSRQHADAKSAKQTADEVAAEKAKARAEKIKAGEKPEEEKRKVWTHRATRHKQTMPAQPKLDETR